MEQQECRRKEKQELPCWQQDGVPGSRSMPPRPHDSTRGMTRPNAALEMVWFGSQHLSKAPLVFLLQTPKRGENTKKQRTHFQSQHSSKPVLGWAALLCWRPGTCFAGIQTIVRQNTASEETIAPGSPETQSGGEED